jgi:hypothetical protein
MKPDTTSTHKPRAVDPHAFRSQATGVGNTLTTSRATGSVRCARVAAATPANQRAATPSAEGQC